MHAEKNIMFTYNFYRRWINAILWFAIGQYTNVLIKQSLASYFQFDFINAG
jgi:hypothetical protein